MKQWCSSSVYQWPICTVGTSQLCQQRRQTLSSGFHCTNTSHWICCCSVWCRQEADVLPVVFDFFPQLVLFVVSVSVLLVFMFVRVYNTKATTFSHPSGRDSGEPHASLENTVWFWRWRWSSAASSSLIQCTAWNTDTHLRVPLNQMDSDRCCAQGRIGSFTCS